MPEETFAEGQVPSQGAEAERPARSPAPRLGASTDLFAASDRPLTCKEIADYLHISVRVLKELISKHQPPVIEAGRTILFDEIAYLSLREAMRRGPSSARAERERPHRRSSGRSKDPTFEEVLKRLSKNLPNQNALPDRPRQAEASSTPNRRGNAAGNGKTTHEGRGLGMR